MFTHKIAFLFVKKKKVYHILLNFHENTSLLLLGSNHPTRLRYLFLSYLIKNNIFIKLWKTFSNTEKILNMKNPFPSKGVRNVEIEPEGKRRESLSPSLFIPSVVDTLAVQYRETLLPVRQQNSLPSIS